MAGATTPDLAGDDWDRFDLRRWQSVSLVRPTLEVHLREDAMFATLSIEVAAGDVSLRIDPVKGGKG